jgi:hypothetical protein
MRAAAACGAVRSSRSVPPGPPRTSGRVRRAESTRSSTRLASLTPGGARGAQPAHGRGGLRAQSRAQPRPPPPWKPSTAAASTPGGRAMHDPRDRRPRLLGRILATLSRRTRRSEPLRASRTDVPPRSSTTWRRLCAAGRRRIEGRLLGHEGCSRRPARRHWSWATRSATGGGLRLSSTTTRRITVSPGEREGDPSWSTAPLSACYRVASTAVTGPRGGRGS